MWLLNLCPRFHMILCGTGQAGTVVRDLHIEWGKEGHPENIKIGEK